MYSWEIKNLLELKNYVLSVKEYLHICNTSPQIREIKYDPYCDNFMLETEENIKLFFKVKKEG